MNNQHKSNPIHQRLSHLGSTRILPLVVLLGVPGSMRGQNYYYFIDDGAVAITQYVGPGGAVIIPGTIEGLPVTSIGTAAFYDLPNLTSVTIPGSVTNIGSSAFERCTGLTELALSSNVMSIGNRAFSGCSSLGAITVDPLNSAYSSLDGALFDKSQNLLMQYPALKPGPYKIPNSVRKIDEGAFAGCGELTGVTFPSGLIEIGSRAFAGCSGLSDIQLQDNLASIGEAAFWGCHGLTNATIGNGVTNIGGTAFLACTSLANVTVGNRVLSIGDSTFYDCSDLTIIRIPSSATKIGRLAFVGCTSLHAIAVDSLNPAYTSLDGVLFDKQLTTLIQCPAGRPAGAYKIPDSVTGIGESAFDSCSELADITIPNSVDNIGRNAFCGCAGLVNVLIPNSVRNIAEGAFGFCAKLSSVEIGTGLTNLSDSVFANCCSLTNIVIPDGVTAVGGGAFQGCSSLTNVVIGDSTTWIGSGAFWGCTSLVDINIPSGVTTIGSSAFAECASLTGVYFKGNAPSGSSDVFYGDSLATAYYLPGTLGWSSSWGGRPTELLYLRYAITNGAITITGYSGPGGTLNIPSAINGMPVTSIVATAFKDSTNLTSIIIPDTVTNLGDFAFFHCIGLTGLYFNGNAPSIGAAVFDINSQATVYYLPGLAGWSSTFAGRPTAQWAASSPLILATNCSADLQTNGFSFLISWATNIPVVIQVCTNLSDSTWLPLQTNTLTSGLSYFNDPHWTNSSIQFYRVASTVEPIVFSSKVVGYVTTPFAGGGRNGLFQMIANPLNTTNNTIGFLIPSAPDGTVLYKYDRGVFLIATYFLGAWDHPEYTLDPGEGAIACSPSPWSNTFVGEVLQGALSNPFPTGFSIRASQAPVEGTLTALGLSGAGFGDTIFRFNTASQCYVSSTFLGAWSPDLTIAVGESLWLQTSSPGTWSRFFSVP